MKMFRGISVPPLSGSQTLREVKTASIIYVKIRTEPFLSLRYVRSLTLKSTRDDKKGLAPPRATVLAGFGSISSFTYGAARVLQSGCPLLDTLHEAPFLPFWIIVPYILIHAVRYNLVSEDIHIHTYIYYIPETLLIEDVGIRSSLNVSV